MGIPPIYVIEELRDPTSPYDYVIYLGAMGTAYYHVDEWILFFEQHYGTKGLDFGGPWFYSTYTKKLYFKKEFYPFFILKFGDVFNKRPWES